MTQETIESAAIYLKEGRGGLKQEGARLSAPPVLFLGAGASAEAGPKPMGQLMPEAFQCKTFDQFLLKIAPMTSGERFSRLFDYLQSPDPYKITPGYRALGRLIGEGYFDLILSTNFDPVLEDSLVAAGMRRRHYLLLINQVVQPKWMESLLAEPMPRVKIVKMHGDLFHRVMAWTPSEMEDYLASLGPRLENALAGRDIMVAGHSLADSPRIERLVKRALSKERAVWFVNRSDPPAQFVAHQHVRGVIGEQGRFEAFFPGLAQELLESEAPAPFEETQEAAARPPMTPDDLMTSVVGIGPNGGRPFATGFVLQEPRLIVSDSYPVTSAGDKQRLTLTAADGRRFPARRLKLVRSHPFGPVLFEAPEGLAVPGLPLHTQPPPPNTRVRVGVAAGDRIGLTSGYLRLADEQSVRIAQIPRPVANLVHLECPVAQGSSGAPVVDPQFGVIGFIVAGSSDVNHPDAYMYPSWRWTKDLPKPE